MRTANVLNLGLAISLVAMAGSWMGGPVRAQGYPLLDYSPL